MKWQPMETAPRDGTPILAVWGKYGVQIIRWHSWEEDAALRIKAGGCWMPANQHCAINVRPTHWQPLPTLPEET